MDSSSLSSTALAMPAKDDSLTYKLIEATFNGELERIKDLILVQGADIYCKKYHWTPIHWAAARSQLGSLKVLLELGANVNKVESEYGCTALHLAMKNQWMETVKYLAGAGADANAQTFTKATPLMDAVLYNSSRLSTTPRCVKWLVRHANADPGKCDMWGNTPLIVAAMNGCLDMVEYLVRVSKKSLNKPNDDGLTPLHVAMSKNYDDIVMFLVESGANIDMGNNQGLTPLHVGAANGSSFSVQLLIKMGSPVDILDAQGRSPLHVAVSSSMAETVLTLLDAGADVNLQDHSGGTVLTRVAAGCSPETAANIVLCDRLRADTAGWSAALERLNGESMTVRTATAGGSKSDDKLGRRARLQWRWLCVRELYMMAPRPQALLHPHPESRFLDLPMTAIHNIARHLCEHEVPLGETLPNIDSALESYSL